MPNKCLLTSPTRYIPNSNTLSCRPYAIRAPNPLTPTDNILSSCQISVFSHPPLGTFQIRTPCLVVLTPYESRPRSLPLTTPQPPAKKVSSRIPHCTSSKSRTLLSSHEWRSSCCCGFEGSFTVFNGRNRRLLLHWDEGSLVKKPEEILKSSGMEK